MDAYIYRLMRFIFLFICLILSIICFLIVFFFLFKSRQINYKILQNHVILALLFCNFILITTELPITLVYSYYGHIQPENDQFCSFWVGYNYSLYDIGLLLITFGSIERYFLIFHERFIRKWRFIIHYPPIVFCFIYPLMFYNLLVNFYPCEAEYDYESYVCGGACYQFQTIISTIDYITNIFSPVVCMVLINIILLFRVIYRKQAMKIANTWRKNRLMYIQLVSISVLYFIIWIPFCIISLIRLFYNPFFLQDVTMLLINYCLYICPLASPLISLVGLPVVRQHLRRLKLHIPWAGHITENRIRPTGIIVLRTMTQHHTVSRRHNDEHQV
ncbi:unnamed protein product [Adineta steineri]|uniref:G-protein coupled receptors family 1 profile domain-containing protein n=1 Tax=Adineta steineri TaxID=433720 RepID=A0A815LUH4_9BILA|nr:unnamed protein product [Adineta steineri]CAF1414922.1 unnamed protein product [Adineta steineri]